LSFISYYWFSSQAPVVVNLTSPPTNLFFGITQVYLNGGNLKDLIAAARPEPVAMFTAVSIAHGIAKLLAELHSHQLAYGNLTPASVILKPNLTQLGFFYVLLAKGTQCFLSQLTTSFPPPKQNRASIGRCCRDERGYVLLWPVVVGNVESSTSRYLS